VVRHPLLSLAVLAAFVTVVLPHDPERVVRRAMPGGQAKGHLMACLSAPAPLAATTRCHGGHEPAASAKSLTAAWRAALVSARSDWAPVDESESLLALACRSRAPAGCRAPPRM
jgi:hypothetical protein